MLKKIQIQNYAIIDHLEMLMPPGLNVITGETGAGKSILLGALGLVMGKRADSKVLFDQDRKCIVEAEFGIESYKLQDFFDQEGLDYDDDLIIRREIAPGGKSRAFINDTPVNLDQLQQLTEKLVVIHQQFDMLDIQRPAFQLEVIDALAGNNERIPEYRRKYKELQQLKKKLEELIQRNQASRNEADYIEFQLEELEKLNFQHGEQEVAEQLLNRLSAAEDIKRITGSVAHIIEDAEIPVSGQLRTLMQQLDQIKHVDDRLENLYQRLDGCYEELSDIAGEAADLAENTEYDEALISSTSDRLNQIYRMLKKHNQQDLEALLIFTNNLRNSFSLLAGLEDEIKKVENQIGHLQSELESLANILSQNRHGVTGGFEQKINEGIRQLGMEHGSIQVAIKQLNDMTSNGKDDLSLMFAPNKGSKFQPLKDIASGGEISRLTLCIKAFLAGSMTLPTLIFDEIDTGVSGEIAKKMASLLYQLSQKHQVITISHAPQIAAGADHQFFVFKKISGHRTTTDIRILNTDERIIEIAKMLSGDPPTNTAIANARELIGTESK
jgi:DNA repair protein RecN (Recombination protein N)